MRQRQTFFFPRRSTTTTFLPTHLSSHFSCGYLLIVILPSPKYPEVPEGMPQVPTLPSWILLNMLWKSPWSTVCIFYFMNLYTNLQSVSAFVKCQEQKKRKTQFNISIGIPHNAKSFASNPLRLPGTNPPRMKPKDAGTAAHPSVLTWSRPNKPPLPFHNVRLSLPFAQKAGVAIGSPPRKNRWFGPKEEGGEKGLLRSEISDN